MAVTLSATYYPQDTEYKAFPSLEGNIYPHFYHLYGADFVGQLEIQADSADPIGRRFARPVEAPRAVCRPGQSVRCVHAPLVVQRPAHPPCRISISIQPAATTAASSASLRFDWPADGCASAVALCRNPPGREASDGYER